MPSLTNTHQISLSLSRGTHSKGEVGVKTKMDEMMDGCKHGDVSKENRIHIMNDEGHIVSKRMPDNILASLESEQTDFMENDSGIKQQQLDDWLPITQSRKGNSWTVTFHLLCSGIGTQTLSLPLAFVYLGW